MGRYRIAGCTVEYEPIYPLLKRKMEAYEVAGMEALKDAEIVLNLTEDYLRMRRRENPSLSLSQCEYICAGIQFNEKILEYGGFLLHGSAVEYRGGAYVFTAPSGTGKSTHAGLWQERFGRDEVHILNDDKPVIRLENEKILVYGTPFSGKTDLNLNRCAPLRGICILEQGSVNNVERVEAKTAVPYLFSQTILPETVRRFDALFEMMERVLKDIPVFRMQCNISVEAAAMAYDAMKGEQE